MITDYWGITEKYEFFMMPLTVRRNTGNGRERLKSFTIGEKSKVKRRRNKNNKVVSKIKNLYIQEDSKMLGVDQFRSVEHAKQCYQKAEARLAKFNLCFLISVVLSVFFWVNLFWVNHKFRTLSDIMAFIWVVGVIVLYTYEGTWWYLWKLATIPFRKFAVGVFFLIPLFIFLCFAQCCIGLTLLFQGTPLLYERYLCRITKECAGEIIGETV